MIVNPTLQRIDNKRGLDVVTTWSTDWKMLLPAQKSECSFFSTDSHESRWQPTCTLDDQPVRYDATPIFFGVTYDRMVTLFRHVGNSLKRQAGALRRLSYTSWGYDSHTLSATYITTGRSKVEYIRRIFLAAWISNSTMENQERSQRYTGRAITGQLRTTPTETIIAEANLPSIKTREIQLSTIAMEK